MFLVSLFLFLGACYVLWHAHRALKELLGLNADLKVYADELEERERELVRGWKECEAVYSMMNSEVMGDTTGFAYEEDPRLESEGESGMA